MGGVALALVMGAALLALRWLPEREESSVRAAYQSARYARAKQVLDLWLQKSPDSPEAQYWRARIALVQRRPEEAREALRLADALGCSRGRLDLLRAIATALGGRFTEVEPLLRDAFNRGEADPLLDEVLARFYLENYDLSRAELVLKRWVRDSPKDPKPYLWLAEVDLRRGKAESVLDDYQQALLRDPSLDQARLALAKALREAHRLDEAVDVISAFISRNPKDPAGLLAAGCIAAERGDREGAAALLESVLAADPKNVIALKEMADLLMRRGNYARALTMIDQASAIDPFDIGTHYSRGVILARLGREGESQAEQSLAGKLRLEQQELLAAQARLIIFPDDEEARIRITRWMLTHGQGNEGVRWAETILRDQPGQLETCRLLADYYEQSGQPGLANFYRSRSHPTPAP
jgi:predicted Zn-dependent protease